MNEQIDLDGIGLGNLDFNAFNDKIDEAKEKHGVKDQQELKKELPQHNTNEHGTVALVSINDIALTDNGELTRTKFFEKMDVDKSVYGEIALTDTEAKSLALTFRNLTTGVNSVIPLKCTAEECPFQDACWFVMNQKAPVGKPCIIEHQLLKYHTGKFIEEFDVDMASHSEIMLIQELSELIVFEMRVTRVLSDPANAQLMGLKLKFSPDGDPVEEETIHWAWGLKEQIKNRRMKILNSLNATRQAKVPLQKYQNEGENDYLDTLKGIKNVIMKLQDDSPYQEIPNTEQANDNGRPIRN